MAVVTVHSGFGAQETKICHCFHFSPINLTWSDGIGCHDLSFFNVEFKPTFSLSSFTFFKRLFSSSLLFAIKVVSSAYLKLLIYLPAILIPACESPSPAFHLMYSAWRGLPYSSNGKESACNAGDPDSISGLGKSPEEGIGDPLQYPCLENSMDRGAWCATVCKSWTWLRN